MPYVKAQVTIPRDSNLPEDVFVNTLYFDSSAGTAATLAAAAHVRLTAFYQAIDASLAAEVASPATVKYFNMAEVEPRVPVAIETIALTPNAAAGFPSEVAVTLSFQGALVSGFNQARRRGRIFIGPIANTSANWDQTTAGITVGSGLRTTIATAADALATDGADDLTWGVMSQATLDEGGALVDAFTPITNGWVDNAWDTIRSRGLAPTLRTTFAA